MTRLLPWVGAVLLIATGVCILGFFASAGRQNRRSDADSERAALPNALPHKPSPDFVRAAMRHPVARRIDLDAELAAVSPCNDPTCTQCRPPAA